MKKLFILALLPIAVGCSNSNSSKIDKFPELAVKAKNIFAMLPAEAVNADNPATEEKIALGKMLYFDNRLSKDNKQSCNTCHNLATFGVDNKAFSEGNDGGLGGRNSPTTLNAAFHLAQFWDGREPDVEAQAGGPILNPVEMAMPDEQTVVERLAAVKEYQVAFAKAFPNDNPAITYANLKKAIGAFERKLVTPSRFDDYIAGDHTALTDAEKRGLQTFMKSGCTTCHSGALLGGNMYQKFGLYGNYWEYTNSKKIDEGRFEVTKNEADKYMFKVPSLRNVEMTGPYFHDGSVATLDEAIKIMAKTQVNTEITNLEMLQIKTFLKTLTGTVPAELTQNSEQ